MIFTALSLVLIIFFGTLFDEFSRSLLSLVFAAVFLYVFERLIGLRYNRFLVLSVASLVPYVIWTIFDGFVQTPYEQRFDITALMKVLPLAAAAVVGLELLFRYSRNREAPATLRRARDQRELARALRRSRPAAR